MSADKKVEVALGDPNIQELLKAAIEGSEGVPAVPAIYANGFVLGLGNADIVLLLQRNGKSVATLNLSFTLAKTLSKQLAKSIADLEKLSGQPILTTEDITAFKQRGKDGTSH